MLATLTPEMVQYIEFFIVVVVIMVTVGIVTRWVLNYITDEIRKERNEVKNIRDEVFQITMRLASVEGISKSDVPRWTRGQSGVFQSVSPEFMRIFGAPHGYKVTDILGRTPEELTHFSSHFRIALKEMDDTLLQNGFASRAHVPLSDKLKVTIIKGMSHSATGDVLFVGYAVPELGE